MPSPTIYAFVQPGCPACAAFKPKLRSIAKEYERRGVKTVVVNLGDTDPKLQALADRYKIEATPTIVAGGVRREGDLPRAELRGIYDGMEPLAAAPNQASSTVAIVAVGVVSAVALGLTAWLGSRKRPSLRLGPPR